MASPPYRLIARDDTGRVVEIYCPTSDKALENAADFRSRGYADVCVYDAHGRQVEDNRPQT